MKLICIFALSLTIFSCSGSSEEDIVQNDRLSGIDTNTTELDTTTELQEAVDVYTAIALVDGPDNSLWITSKENLNGGKDKEIPLFKELHIIPSNDNNDGQVNEYMLGMIVNDFGFWGQFDSTSATVKVFYDVDKKVEMANYQIINGQPDGRVMVYEPDGSVFMNRTYKKGNWIDANESPAAVDWTFSQKESKLWIKDKQNGIFMTDSGMVVNIMPTFRAMEPGDNRLGAIIEKASFKHPFKINDKVFTGVLNGYETPSSLTLPLYFELNFVGGWLHGDAKIYNEWGDLQLHEIFVEGELDTTVYEMDYSEMDGLAKPIIYLYPEKEQWVDVKLKIDGKLTTTYPAYKNGWRVKAEPDGTLTDEKGQTYYALYWEAENRKAFTIDEGFVVKGSETAAFLEKSLTTIGLNRREANEFIVYWLPQMQHNPYNLIHFSTVEYEEMAQLQINPKPESLIRVMMVFQPLDEPIALPQQNLQNLRMERKGFTVVEWGGHKMNKADRIIF